jgi:hypothetical protein
MNIHLIKISEGQEWKIFSGGGCQWEEGGHKERGNESVYGEYILYPYMKIEEQTFWNCSKQEGKRENDGEGKSS